MKKLGLLPRLILGIILGIVIGNLNLPSIVRILATFNSIFGNFLGFTIPLIIVGFIIPGIADLGKSAGKLLGVDHPHCLLLHRYCWLPGLFHESCPSFPYHFP